MSKKRGKTNAPKARDEAKPETQTADAVRDGDPQPAGAGAEAAAGEPAAVAAGKLETLSAGDPLVEDDANQGTQADLVTGGDDGQATQADGGGQQDPAAQGIANPDGPAAAIDLHATTDGMVWAKEFIRITQAGDFEIPQLWDPGYMVGWFANAIETGRSAGLKHASDPDGKPADRAVRDSRRPDWDSNVVAALFAASHAYAAHQTGRAWIGFDVDDDAVDEQGVHELMDAAATFVRSNGLVSGETIVIHLRRAGHKSVPAADARSLVAWKVFAITLLELDALDKQENQARRDAEASAESVKAAQAFGEGLQGRGPFATSKGGPFDATGFSPR